MLHIFSFSLFPNGFRLLSGTCLFLFQPDVIICIKIIKKSNFTDFKF